MDMWILIWVIDYRRVLDMSDWLPPGLGHKYLHAKDQFGYILDQHKLIYGILYADMQ